MKDVFKHITIGEGKNKKEYPFVFNINVTQAITKKYGSIQKWADTFPTGDIKDVDADMLDAIIFIYRECINEGIDMENDPESEHYIKREAPRLFINDKQTGRIMTAIEDYNKFVMDTVTESNDTGKEKNLMTDQNQTTTAE
jgi:hypothetical protein